MVGSSDHHIGRGVRPGRIHRSRRPGSAQRWTRTSPARSPWSRGCVRGSGWPSLRRWRVRGRAWWSADTAHPKPAAAHCAIQRCAAVATEFGRTVAKIVSRIRRRVVRELITPPVTVRPIASALFAHVVLSGVAAETAGRAYRLAGSERRARRLCGRHRKGGGAPSRATPRPRPPPSGDRWRGTGAKRFRTPGRAAVRGTDRISLGPASK